MKMNVYLKFVCVILSFLMFACNDDSETNSNDIIFNGKKVAEKIDIPVIDKINLESSEKVGNDNLNKFAINFFNVASSHDNVYKDGNVVVSPLSASIALTLLANTCDKEMEDAIVEMLGQSNIASLNSVTNKLMRFLPSKTNGATLTLANSVWYADDLSPEALWRDNLVQNLYSEIAPLNFRSAESVDIVNRWCYEQTEGMIDNFIDKLDENTSVCLLNALYFAGNWAKKFDKTLTDKATFNGRDEKSSISMMHMSNFLKFSKANDYNAVFLPMEGNAEIMMILPNSENKAKAIAENINFEEYSDLVISRRNALVTLSIPKFEINTTSQLESFLHAMGMPLKTKIFDLGSEEDQDVKVKQNIHSIIDEDGAKVAATTIAEVIASTPDISKIEEVTLTFDRPFIYIVRNTVTGTILISGIINNL